MSIHHKQIMGFCCRHVPPQPYRKAYQYLSVYQYSALLLCAYHRLFPLPAGDTWKGSYHPSRGSGLVLTISKRAVKWAGADWRHYCSGGWVPPPTLRTRHGTGKRESCVFPFTARRVLSLSLSLPLRCVAVLDFVFWRCSCRCVMLASGTAWLRGLSADRPQWQGCVMVGRAGRPVNGPRLPPSLLPPPLPLALMHTTKGCQRQK